MVDCSHANSEKNPALQSTVARDVAAQIAAGNRSIVGLMLESNLEAGSQSISKDSSALRYGVSITDGCISWATTEALVCELAESLRTPLKQREHLANTRQS
jgi:3-deoxy-7-phosphoheptulonate synthase